MSHRSEILNARRLLLDGDYQKASRSFVSIRKTLEKEGTDYRVPQALYLYSEALRTFLFGPLSELPKCKQQFIEAVRILENVNQKEWEFYESSSRYFGICADVLGGVHEWDLEETRKKLRRAIQLVDNIRENSPQSYVDFELPLLETKASLFMLQAVVAHEEDDSATFDQNAVECRQVCADLVARSAEDNDARIFYEVFADVVKAMFSAFKSESKDIEFRLQLRAAARKLEHVEEGLIGAKAKMFRAFCEGTEEALEAKDNCRDGQDILALDRGPLATMAKSKFESSLILSAAATDWLGTAGLFGWSLLRDLPSLREMALQGLKRAKARSAHPRRQLALAASKQFFMLFFVTLAVLVVLNFYGILLIESGVLVMTALVVALISAFGLKALNLLREVLKLRPR